MITGSSGFLGMHIVERLHKMGVPHIVAYDRLEPETRLTGIHYVTGDVLDRDPLYAASRSIDCVFHAAALVPLAKAGKDFRKVNAEGTARVINACRENGIGMLVFLSSSAIYGKPEEVPITDRTAYNPMEPYGRSKLLAERYIWEYITEGGRAACIRPRTIIGGRSRMGIFEILFDWIYTSHPVYIIGDGSNSLQFLHVEDLLDAMLLAAAGRVSGLYNIGTAVYGGLRDELTELIDFAGSKSRIVSIPVPAAEITLTILDKLRLSPLTRWHYHTFYKSFVFDISTARTMLGWDPRYSNMDAFKESYSWYTENREKIKEPGRSIHRRPARKRLLKLLR